MPAGNRKVICVHKIGSQSPCGCVWASWMLLSTNLIQFTYNPTFVKTVYLNGSQKKVDCLRGLRLTTPWTFQAVRSRERNKNPPPLSPLQGDIVPLPQPAQKVVNVTNFLKSTGCSRTHSSLDTTGSFAILTISLLVSFSVIPMPAIVPTRFRVKCDVISSKSQSTHAG